MKTPLAFVAAVALCAQTAPEGARKLETPDSGPPVFRVTAVSRTVKSINYRHRSGATKINFGGTALMPAARGEAKVESKQGYIEIEVEFAGLTPPGGKFGREYLTYVLWAVTPEGRATNLGEIILDPYGRGKLNVTTELQAFALIVTVEPYFAVSQPSDLVIMENTVRPDTLGKVELVDARFELLQRGQYSLPEPQPANDARLPLQLQEAANAIEISRHAGADRYAADVFEKAQGLWRQSQDYQRRKQAKPAAMIARQAVQTAEDARAIAVKRIEEERLAQERQAAADREAKAKAEAEAEAQRRARAEAEQRAEAERRRLAEQERLAAEKARSEAEQARAAAEQAAQLAAKLKAEAEAARAEALTQQQAAQAEAEKARLAADELRERLRQQLNKVLETRDSARGLIVNMSDVLFDSGKATLKPGAREKLAKVAGLLLGHPALRLEIEGHTDSVGSEEYNQRLSIQRAIGVQEYLLENGITEVTAQGYGESRPVASNDDDAGRQRNRRVELIVSGEAIGTEPSATRTTP
ncbi:MAG: OmpA family protein [Acidobacteria bacterium]|nr:OmpA family protein [Acidobacteriota bacterium]